MDYSALAVQLTEQLASIHRSSVQKQLEKFANGEMFILGYLVEHEGETVLPSELSVVMEISTARVAAVLNNLEGKGLILRKMSPSDRRKILVSVTETGRQKVTRQRDELLHEMEGFLQALGEEDAREYMRLTKRIVKLYRAREEKH